MTISGSKALRKTKIATMDNWRKTAEFYMKNHAIDLL